ncbi:MAG: hypothetical protein J6T98_03870 [Salinivirgaceae bacterium]|nr:hypothetical protein [Salinivirgaceae bacterium]
MRKVVRNFAIAIASMLFVGSITVVDAQSRNKVRKLEYNSRYNYEVSTVAVGVDGTKVVKVWGYGKKAEDAMRNAKELGVACALFRGFPAGSNGSAAPTPAIISDPNADTKYEEYFTKFFEPGGKYLQYVNYSSDAVPTDRVKVNKKTYKVGVVLSIAYDELRKEMEREGIARKLNSGF